MRIALLVNRVLLTLLSISTGAVKLAGMAEEMEIFRAAGFPDALTVVFGVVQVAGGLLLLPNVTTRYGAWVMVPTFVIASGVLFVNGLLPFGVFSLLFIASAVVHGVWGVPPKNVIWPGSTCS